jgi:TRAP-type C4-dicarboxylate transport system permease small subunit
MDAPDHPEDQNAGPFLGALVRALAFCGGLLGLGLALLVSVSVSLRALMGEGITGDFELVQIMAAIVAFACFPLCVAVRGNFAIVSFTSYLLQRFNQRLDALWDLVLAVIFAIIAWRLVIGASDQFKSGTTLMMSGISIWWAVALCAALAFVTSVTALILALRAVCVTRKILALPECGTHHERQ